MARQEEQPTAHLRRSLSVVYESQNSRGLRSAQMMTIIAKCLIAYTSRCYRKDDILYNTVKEFHQRGGREKWEEACDKVYFV